MSFEPGFDIGIFSAEFSTANYVSESGKVFTPLSVDISLDAEFSTSNYVAEGVKSFTPLSVDISPVLDLGTTYVKVYVDKTYTGSAEIYSSVLPVIPGDTGVEIVLGYYADFYAVPRTQNQYSEVDFYDATMGPAIASYTWDFGDGHIESTISPDISHIYDVAGSYDIQLSVTSLIGVEAYTKKDQYINIIASISESISESASESPSPPPAGELKMNIEIKNAMIYCKSANVDFSTDSEINLSGYGMTIKTPGTFRAYADPSAILTLSDSVIDANVLTD